MHAISGGAKYPKWLTPAQTTVGYSEYGRSLVGPFQSVHRDPVAAFTVDQGGEVMQKSIQITSITSYKSTYHKNIGSYLLLSTTLKRTLADNVHLLYVTTMV